MALFLVANAHYVRGFGLGLRVEGLGCRGLGTGGLGFTEILGLEV